MRKSLVELLKASRERPPAWIYHALNRYNIDAVTIPIIAARRRHMSEVQNSESSNVERLIFSNFKITNIKIAKDVLFDYFIYEFVFYYYFFKLLENSKYLIIFPNYKIF